MKMKGLRVSLALLLVLVLLTALTPAAFAADVERGYTVTLGDNVWIAIESPNAQNVATYSLDSGSLPEGLSYGVNGNSLVVHGTVTALGNTAAAFSVTAGPSTYTYSIDFFVTETPVATPAPTPDPAAPAAAAAQTAPAANNAKLPRVTKSPTDETVEEGKQAEFVARYENAIWAVWKFISPDGNTVLRYDEAKDYFEGLVIIDGNYSHMILKKIPYSLNGWRVACEYRNNDGSVMTDMATITVIPKVTPTPEPTPIPTPAPTPEPTPAPTPAASESAGAVGTDAQGTESAGGAAVGGIDPATAGVIQASDDGSEGGEGGASGTATAVGTGSASAGSTASTGKSTAASRFNLKKFPLIPLLVILLAAVAIGLLVFFLRRRREDEEDEPDFEEPVVRRAPRSSRSSGGYQGRHTAHTERYEEDDYERDDSYDDEDYDEDR